MIGLRNMTTASITRTVTAATYTVQLEWSSLIDELSFYEAGAIDFAVIGKDRDGAWIIELEFRSYSTLTEFMVGKYGVSYEDIELYLVP